jgi:esterase/lipase superfamily enzyme
MKQRTRGRTVTTDLAALAAGVPEATIRKWASRGKLTRYGSRNRAEYSLDELREILRTNARAAKIAN